MNEMRAIVEKVSCEQCNRQCAMFERLAKYQTEGAPHAAAVNGLGARKPAAAVFESVK
jgi:hypothetical protein